MPTEQWHEFVTRGAHTGKTVGADGAPHVAPVWYVFDAADFLFTAGGEASGCRRSRDRSSRGDSAERETGVPGKQGASPSTHLLRRRRFRPVWSAAVAV